ncbi:unnamed protein product [Ixodes pacificus]
MSIQYNDNTMWSFLETCPLGHGLYIQHVLDVFAVSTVAQRLEAVANLNIKPRRVLKGHQGKVLCSDWSLDKRHIVSSSQDGKMIIWDAFTTNKEHAVTMPTTWVMACAYAPSGNMVACGGLDNKVTVYPLSFEEDVSTKKKAVGTHTSYMSCCLFPNSDQQVQERQKHERAESGWASELGTIASMLHGFEACRCLLSLSVALVGHGHNTKFGPAGRLAGSILFIHIEPRDKKFTKEKVSQGFISMTCRLYDLRADREVAVYSKQSIIFGVNSVDFSVSGRLLFAGYNDYTVNVWDALKCVRLSILYGHENRVTCLKVSPDGTALSTGSWDFTLRVGFSVPPSAF